MDEPPAPTVPESEDAEAVGLDRAERIGPLHLGMSASEVEAALGRPTKLGKKVEEAASGDVIQTWSYPAIGVSIDMVDHEEGQKVSRFTVTSPSTLETSRGIEIGSSRAELEAAYGSDRDAEMSTDDVFIAGSVYGGVFFHLEEGSVTSIFVGAGAE